MASATEIDIQFHHLHLYVHSLKPLSAYKRIEGTLNQLANLGSFDPFSGGMRYLDPKALPSRVAEGRRVWQTLVDPSDAADPATFVPTRQDIVEQLIVGLGWRVCAHYAGGGTTSVLVASSDPLGVKFVVTALDAENTTPTTTTPYDHFRRDNLTQFFGEHSDRDGIAVLGFEVSNVDEILERYRAKHPKLLKTPQSFLYVDSRTVTQGTTINMLELGRMRIGEVFAYYKGDEADRGTVIRFVERSGECGARQTFSNPEGVLPGLLDVNPRFDGTTVPSYSDHWVSNVVNRRHFLDTLHDTLGFTPKVDFNAGVVAAGEAQIESTVTGNTIKRMVTTEHDALVNQTQVYLPTNNALSTAGHVYLFLQELGQGIQHVACRVESMVPFIERVNNYRAITGRGFSFLKIPRSYYGRLVPANLQVEGVSPQLAEQAYSALQRAGLVSISGIVDLDATDDDLLAPLLSVLPADQARAALAPTKRARYSNMYSLLRDVLSEGQYLQIVRNQILVDIQGQDILYQIFTANILQRDANHEAPFIEFIQRDCAECRGKSPDEPCRPIKPGCGGFGIRNFLTLFLSIEVSKAMLQLEQATAAHNARAAELATKKIEIFTSQLDTSNPILTAISDAMTNEADLLEEIKNTHCGRTRAGLEVKVEHARAAKEAAQQELMRCSAHHLGLMAEVRKQEAAL